MSFFDYGDAAPGSARGPAITVFENLSEEEWQTVIHNSQPIDFRKGEVLVHEGERDDAVYILVSGAVEVIGKSMLGGGKQIALIDEGSVFGEVAFFDGQSRSASIRGLRDGQVLRISRHGFERIAAWNPALAQQFLFDLGAILAFRFRSEFPYKI